MKIEVVPTSHVDHLPPEVLAALLAEVEGEDTVTIAEWTVPAHLPEVKCALYGPTAGDAPVTDDEAFMAARPGRLHRSRLVNRPVRMTRRVTVVSGPYDGHPCVLYSAYGGPPGTVEVEEAERHNLMPAAMAGAKAFWAVHALAADGLTP